MGECSRFPDSGGAPLPPFYLREGERCRVSLLSWIDRNLEKIVAAITTIVLLASCFAGVISRYVLNMSLTWTEEVSLIALIWLAYFGAAISVTRRRHLRIELVPMLCFGEKGQKIVSICVNIVFLGFALFIVKGTFDMAMLAQRTNQVFAATGIPKWTSIMAVPGAFSVIALRVFQDTLRHIREYRAMGTGRSGDAPHSAA